MAPPLDLPSNIKAVTVYRRGAMVTREVTLPARAELPQRVQLVGLPLGLDDSSVRVELRGAAGLVAGDLQLTLAVPSASESLAPPSNAELEAAALALELAKAHIAELELARARLTKLEALARAKPEEGKAPAPSPTDARLALLEFRRARMQDTNEEIAKARAQLPALEEQLAQLQERQRQASSARNARAHELRKAAIVTLEQEGGGEEGEQATLALHYFVPGARWAPSYTVRLDRAMKQAALELRAMVGQHTGEDWSGVALTLSTANPQQWTELPELESRRIGRRQPPPAKTGWRAPPVGAAALYADYDRAMGDAPEPEPPAPPAELAREVLFEREKAELFDDIDAAPEPEPELKKSRKRAAAAPSRGWVPPMPGAAGRPPPASMPVPQMSMPAPQMARSKSSGLGNLVGSAIDGLSSAFASEGYGGGGPPGAGMALGLAEEPELLAGRDLLDYGRLRLSPADDAKRGALHRVDLRVQYRQLSVESLSVELAFSQIAEAREWSSLLESESPPQGHSWPRGEDGFDYAYVAATPVDLRSTGAFCSLPVDLRDAPAHPRYVSVPRESQDVFRIVAVQNPFAAPLLPGPADVYVDGRFMLTSRVATTPAEGRIEFGIGVEQAIKIARNVSFNEDSEGMFKRSLMLHHTLALEVQNHLSDAALVEIRERLPVAAEAMGDDMVVELDEVEPSWEDYEPKRTGAKLLGGKRWKIEVPAGGKRELRASYHVRIPTNYEVVGGNRRES